MYPAIHRCDERCVCREHPEPLPLLYAPKAEQHACQDPECVNAHGMTMELRGMVFPI